MVHKVGIFYNEPGVRDIMKGSKIADIEQQIMMEKLGRIQAEFFQTFGSEGKFEIKRVDTNSRRSRTSFRIVAADSSTAAILKKHSGWLAKFL